MKVTAIVDLQFGSTGKGSIAGWMGQYGGFDAVTTAWGPNAGHTSVFGDGDKCVRTMISNAAYRSPTIKSIFVAPGSMVNPDALLAEYNDTCQRNINLGYKAPRLFIHEHAAVVLEIDRKMEAEYGASIGSTMKGTAEAVIRKIRRKREANPATMGEYAKLNPSVWSYFVVSHNEYLDNLYSHKEILAEGAQGYSLGINSGFWPYCTSRECTLPQLLSDTLLPVHSVAEVVGVLRTYPIRVANRFNAEGEMIGTSGPCYPDQQEISWESLGRDPELTTVTRLPRRVFTFSMQQVKEAVTRNSVNSVFVNFLNYLPKKEQWPFIDKLSSALPPGCNIEFLGRGPSIEDIEVIDERWADLVQRWDWE